MPTKESSTLITWEELQKLFPESSLNKNELVDIAKTISTLLAATQKTIDQEIRKQKYKKNLDLIKKHLNKASEYMQVVSDKKTQSIEHMPTNETVDIGLTFDDWINIQGMVNRLEQKKQLSTMKSRNNNIYSKLCYELHAVLRGIDSKLPWAKRAELSRFEKTTHFLLKKIDVIVVTDIDSKSSESDITEETFKRYIKMAKAKFKKNYKEQ